MKKFLYEKILSCLLIVFLIGLNSHTYQKSKYINTDKMNNELAVFMYHSFTNNRLKESKYVVNIDDFEKDIIYLKNKGVTFLDLDTLYSLYKSKKPLPKNSVMITIDDGYLNNLTLMLPVIEKHKVNVIISIVGAFTDNEENETSKSNYYSYMTWDEIGEISKSDYVEIINHSYDFHEFNDLRKGSQKNEKENLKDYLTLFYADTKMAENKILDHTNKKPIAYAYPYGMISKESEIMLKCMGYKISFSCREGINKIDYGKNSLFSLSRYLITDKIRVETKY